ncbi:uncharacterized protein UTRI_04459 [Ustilago trichophora]|uniref:Uncharacterized protein n=1 Tax=Ustilago trichophora TaxID=86804 RepID=A0A5C3EGE5_9BASI|nr:uncharacterized protein UTRI_04459 [Ustilago trichophora]
MSSFLSSLLPLAADPFPPTHKAGSEFEGFFIRLESHSGRSQSQPLQPTSSNRSKRKASTPARASPSRIPRLAKSTPHTNSSSPRDTGQLRHRRNPSSSSTSTTSSSSDASSSADPPSPTPNRPKFSSPFSRDSSSREARSMLTDVDPVFASPESYLPPNATPCAKVRHVSATLPTSAPGDLILVVCELQSAPIDQRICIYLRWIVHGEESALYHKLHSGGWNGDARLPSNAREQRESFEIIHYIPSWLLKVGPKKVDTSSVQPFRIDLPSEAGASLGFMEVTADGNVVVDLILPNVTRSQPSQLIGTKLRLRTSKHSPWHPSNNPASTRLPMGTRGPEGWIQHLGLVLPLHWYVHSSSAPAIFSLEHTTLSSNQSEPEIGRQELNDAVAAGRALLHIEKNWGQAFPSGWMWAHGATPLPDPSLPTPASPQPSIRISLAGGSILGLTAFLVGIHVKQGAKVWDWNFTPPLALGPQHTVSSWPDGGRIHYGPGMRMHRNFKSKHFQLDVWDLTKWASIYISGDEDSFATQIPGPRKGAWSPGYCHHSYRCRAQVTLYQRRLGSMVSSSIRAALNPVKSIKGCTKFWCDGRADQDGWIGLGWEKVVQAALRDRVALEFGGNFAQ